MRLNLAMLVCGGFAITAGSSAAHAADPDRQSEVATRGAQIMPFNLSATTHVFTKTAHGGRQQVLVKDPHDNKQIGLIRQHLKEIGGRFSAGDFAAPTDIHGQDMPGLAELRKALPGEIAVIYRDLQDGGQIEYASQSAALVSAIHRWFDAQLSDHGSDATEGHQHDHGHM